MDVVYILTNQSPDWSAAPGAPMSVHRTLEGAKAAFSDGRWIDEWRESQTTPGRWYGPDGCGSIIRFVVQD